MRASLTMIFATVITVATTGPAAADKKMKDLKTDGYTCVRVGVNFLECTKSGGKTYWCTDAGECVEKPRRAVDSGNIRAPTNGVLDPGPNPSPRGLNTGQALSSAPAVRQ